MKKSERFLKMLIITAVGVIIFSVVVIAILNFTSVDKKAKNNSNQTNQTTTNKDSNKNKNSNSNNKSNKESNKSTSSSSTSSSKANENKPATTQENNSTSAKKSENKTNTSSKATENNSGNEANTAGVGNTGKVFSTQAEAHEYGKAEMERRIKTNKKYTEYVIKGIRDSKGAVTGWTVDIFEGENNSSSKTNSGN